MKISKEDLGELHVVAAAAVGLFPRIQVDPAHVVDIIDQLASVTAQLNELQIHTSLVETREKQATEMCTWLTNENQRLRNGGAK